MKRQLFLSLGMLLASGLVAYGVSPSQNNTGVAQDQRVAQQGVQPAPQPNVQFAMPGSNPGMPAQPGRPGAVQPAAPPQDFDAFVPDEWAKEWHHYHWAEAKPLWENRKSNGILFVDARSKVEYDQGHIPGAIPMPLGEFDKFYDQYKTKIKKASKLITYCHGAGCKLSDKVAQRLYKDKGHKNTGSFFGGWPMWQQHNMPVETGPQPK